MKINGYDANLDVSKLASKFAGEELKTDSGHTVEVKQEGYKAVYRDPKGKFLRSNLYNFENPELAESFIGKEFKTFSGNTFEIEARYFIEIFDEDGKQIESQEFDGSGTMLRLHDETPGRSPDQFTNIDFISIDNEPDNNYKNQVYAYEFLGSGKVDKTYYAQTQKSGAVKLDSGYRNLAKGSIIDMSPLNLFFSNLLNTKLN